MALFVATICGYCLWLLFVATVCGHCLWLLFVATVCGYCLWLLFVALFVATVCGDCLWLLFVALFVCCLWLLLLLFVATVCGYCSWLLFVAVVPMIVASHGPEPCRSFVFGPRLYAQHPFDFESAPLWTIDCGANTPLHKRESNPCAFSLNRLDHPFHLCCLSLGSKSTKTTSVFTPLQMHEPSGEFPNHSRGAYRKMTCRTLSLTLSPEFVSSRKPNLLEPTLYSDQAEYGSKNKYRLDDSIGNTPTTGS